MPNWVHCVMTVTGPDATLDGIERHMKDEESDFSFDQLIKRPPDKEDDWYNWNVANWGTKWNACHTDRERSPGELVYIFDTAWAPPMPVVEKFAETFLDVDFTFSYVEEQGWGGDLNVEKGKLIKHTQFDVPSTHKDAVANRGWCYCSDDEPTFDDCYYQRALERGDLAPETLEAVKGLGNNWHGTFDELLEAVARL